MAEPPRRLQAASWRRVERPAYHEPCLAQTVMVKYLLELLSPQAVSARVCLVDQGQSASFPQAQPLGSSQQPVVGRLAARPRESAGECSLDFRFSFSV